MSSLSRAKRRLTSCGAVRSEVSPQGGGGWSLNIGRRATSHATGSCPSSRRVAIIASAIGITIEMTTIRQPVGCSPIGPIIGRPLVLLADPAGEALAADDPDAAVAVRARVRGGGRGRSRA